MSAICGIIGKCAVFSTAERDFDLMSGVLHARGPDRAATYADGSRQIRLGFRFLQSSSGEVSPDVIFNEDRSMYMVCDGHVFNHKELRPWLENKGHSLRPSHSCEALLHLYEEQGVAGWRRVEGQFAIAIWDRNRNHLVLGRD